MKHLAGIPSVFQQKTNVSLSHEFELIEQATALVLLLLCLVCSGLKALATTCDPI